MLSELPQHHSFAANYTTATTATTATHASHLTPRPHAPTTHQVRRLVDDPGKRLAIHVSPAVAVVLSSTVEAEVARIPGKLKALLAVGDLLWKPGLRVLSPAVVAKKFDKQYVCQTAGALCLVTVHTGNVNTGMVWRGVVLTRRPAISHESARRRAQGALSFMLLT